MKCRECPLSMTCLAGRLEEAFMIVAVCPMCGKLFLIRHPPEEAEAAPQKQAEASPRNFVHEYLGAFIPAPRTTRLQLKCEQHGMTRADQQRWRRIYPTVNQYTYTRGWQGPDGMYYRPCPNCVIWPEAHYTEDLDEQKEYEEEKAGATPAFPLRDRR